MANYTAVARSNYFAVKDAEAFNKWTDSMNLSVITKDGLFGIHPSFDSGWPNYIHDEETLEDDYIDFPEELSKHLADGHVAVLMEVGNENLRYVSGRAIAVNSEGKQVVIDLDDIYEEAMELGHDVTKAEY